MGEPWNDDFSYGYLARLIAAAKERFNLAPIRAAGDDSLAHGGSTLFLRHDVDVSLEHALDLARLEADLGVSSTYMVMTSAALYSVEDPASVSILRELISLGHEVGIHFDSVGDAGDPDASLESLRRSLDLACDRLASASGQPVQSISFHRPQPQFLRGPMLVDGRVNAYAEVLMDGYVSDSAGRFREGDPLERVSDRSRPLRQLLTHPIWWGPQHRSAADRLEDFHRERTAGLDAQASDEFDQNLAASLPGVRRAGYESHDTEVTK